MPARGRVKLPTSPRGATRKTTNRPAPNTSSWYSAKPANNCGSSTTSTAPTSGPSVAPLPPTMTTSRKRIEAENGKLLGAISPANAACNPPASPAAPAAITKASARTVSMSMPMPRAAIGASAPARIARPSGLRFSQANPASASAAQMTDREAVWAIVKTWPAMTGGGMPGNPLAPPVRPCHSVAALTTMNPNAIVIIAR